MEHTAIVEAVAAGDGELAGRLLREHVQASRGRLQSALDRPGHAGRFPSAEEI
jgi:DNA-binding GntR family transcriptional regulator